MAEILFVNDEIASERGLSEKVLKEIKHGSWLHDCGKIVIPDDVINKPITLDKYELAQMQAHPFERCRCCTSGSTF